MHILCHIFHENNITKNTTNTKKFGSLDIKMIYWGQFQTAYNIVGTPNVIILDAGKLLFA